MSHIRNSPINVIGSIKVLPTKRDLESATVATPQSQTSQPTSKESIAINEVVDNSIPKTEDKLLTLETIKAHELALYSITLDIKDPIRSFCYSLLIDEDKNNDVELGYVIKTIDNSNVVYLKVSNYSGQDRNIKISYHATF